MQKDIFAMKLKNLVSMQNLIADYLQPNKEGNKVKYKAKTKKNFADDW